MLNFIVNPTYQFLVFLYTLLGHNLGLSIIALTLIIRLVLVPITYSSLKSAKKIQQLKPQLDKLKAKHADKAKLQQAQLELYKQHGINPAAGCLPQIVQLIVLISLYQVFLRILDLKTLNGSALSTHFLWFDLAQPDPLYVLPILAGLSQLVFSFMMQPGLEHHLAKKKDSPKKKEKSENNFEMAEAMQQQMLYFMPAMTTIVALRFPSGLSLYWVITTLFSLIQQYIISGPGGLETLSYRLSSLIKRFKS